MAKYTSLDGYVFDKQSNVGWGLTLKMSGKAPEVAKRIFDTHEHMMYYVNDYNDSCVIGLTLKVVADGDKNGVYFVTAIGTEGENKAFANDGQVVKLGKDSDISSLLDSLSAETSAREIAISNLKSELSGAISAETSAREADISSLTDEIDAIEAKIGEVASGKTIVGMINDTQEAAEAAATKVEKAEGTVHITLTEVTDEETGAITYTIGESDIASVTATTQAISDAVFAETSARTEAINTINEKIDTISGSASNANTAIANEATTRANADSFLSGKVDDNAAAINTLSGSVSSLTTDLNAVKEDVEAFFNATEVGDEVIDTLKEIQDYISSDESGATEMLNKISDNTTAIENEVIRAKAAEAELSGHMLSNELTIAASLTDLNDKITNEASVRETEDDAINAKIGEVTEGTTLVEMIEEAKSAAIAASTVVAEDSEFVTIEVSGEVGKTQTYTIKTTDVASASGVAADISSMGTRISALEDNTITTANEDTNLVINTSTSGNTTIGLQWSSF